MFCATVQLYSHYATVHKKDITGRIWKHTDKKYVL